VPRLGRQSIELWQFEAPRATASAIDMSATPVHPLSAAPFGAHRPCPVVAQRRTPSARRCPRVAPTTSRRHHPGSGYRAGGYTVNWIVLRSINPLRRREAADTLWGGVPPRCTGASTLLGTRLQPRVQGHLPRSIDCVPAPFLHALDNQHVAAEGKARWTESALRRSCGYQASLSRTWPPGWLRAIMVKE